MQFAIKGSSERPNLPIEPSTRACPMPTNWLVSLSGLINRGVPSEEAVRGALPLLRDGLGASDSYLIYGDGASFERYGTSAELELDQAALWTIHRDLTSRKQPRAFNVR